MTSQAQAFLQRWRAQDAAFALLEAFDRGGHVGVGIGLYFELAEIHYRLSERRLAEGKLGWWLDEAAALRAGHARHPLTQALQIAERGDAGAALIEQMAASFDAPTPADRAALVASRSALLGTLQALLGETGPGAPGALDDCFRLASLGQGGADLNHPISLAERARLPAARDELAAAPARAAAMRQALASDWLANLDLRQANPVLAVQVGLWRHALLRNGRAPIAGPMLAWRGWRLARWAQGSGPRAQ